MPIPIIYQDDHFVAVDKPINLPVHKNKHMARDADYLTRRIGDQLGISIYNVHRLDAKTSGLILLAKSSEAAHLMAKVFERREIQKTYVAIVRGRPGDGKFDQPVVNAKKGRKVAASTLFKTIITLPTHISYKDYVDIDLSLVELYPHTGRWHQLRQHCAQQRYDIIGDVHHGDWTLNRIITDLMGHRRLFLHARSLEFIHPYTSASMSLTAHVPQIFDQLIAANLVYK